MEKRVLLARLEVARDILQQKKVEPKRHVIPIKPSEQDLFAEGLYSALKGIELVHEGELEEAHRHLGFVECVLLVTLVQVRCESRKSA